MRILLVEDDREVADILATGLRREPYAVDVATSVDQALRLLHGSAGAQPARRPTRRARGHPPIARTHRENP